MHATKDFSLFEIKADDAGTFEGFASVYGVVDAVGDAVMPGAFDKTVRDRGGKIVILANHDPARSIGVASLVDSARGLRVKGKLLLAIDEARAMHERMKAGLVTGLSIGYQTVRDRVRNGVRELLELDLWEVSLVTFPANTAARVDAVKGDARYFGPIWRALAAESTEDMQRDLADAVATIRVMKRQVKETLR